MKKFNLRLFRHIWEAKGQFIAVSMVVAVGIMTYVAISLAVLDLQVGVEQYYKMNNFQDVSVELTKINEAGLERIRRMPRVEAVQGRVFYRTPLKVEDKDEKVNVGISSIPEAENRINDLYILDGGWIQDERRDVLVLEQFAEARGIKVGDVVHPQIGGKEYELDVRGIVGSPEYIYLMEDEQNLLPQPSKYGIFYVSEEFAQQAFGYSKSYNEVLIKLKNPEEDGIFKDELEKVLERYGVRRIVRREDHVSNRVVSEEIRGARQMAKAIPLVFLGVAAAIIAIMISRMVKNDRTSIGVLKAIGYSNRDILLHYTEHAFIIGAIGSIIGVLAGYLFSGPMANMYQEYYRIPFKVRIFSWTYLGMGFVLSAIYCIGAGLWGARSVLKIAPAESMRPEPPKKIGKTYIQRVTFIWKHISFSWKVVWRNVFRSRKRFVFLSVGIAVTFAVALMPAHMLNVFEAMFYDQYGEFMRMDYEIAYTQPLSERSVMEISELVDVSEIEGKIEFPFEIENGWKSKVVSVIGLKPDTVFYHLTDSDGGELSLSPNGILVSEPMAYILDLEKGDFVNVKNFIPFKDDVRLRVDGVVKQKLGLNAYMDIGFMQKYLMDDEMITGVMLNSTDKVKEKMEDVTNISSVNSIVDLRNIFKDFTKLTYASLSVYAFFAGILGFAIVYNSTMMSISERRLEFSSLRIMGFSKKEINRIVLKENLIMTAFGIVLGIPLGRWLMRLMETSFQTEFYSMTAPIEMNSYIYAAVLTVFYVLIAQYFSSLKIKKLDFIEALKNRIT
ncbi:MAG: FtsX-like permease family protein [Peptostreptococcaceae bacterium]|nr:FtsX-like permease family protein [Peptostreptococcaceae bacterium]